MSLAVHKLSAALLTFKHHYPHLKADYEDPYFQPTTIYALYRPLP